MRGYLNLLCEEKMWTIEGRRIYPVPSVFEELLEKVGRKKVYYVRTAFGFGWAVWSVSEEPVEDAYRLVVYRIGRFSFGVRKCS